MTSFSLAGNEIPVRVAYNRLLHGRTDTQAPSGYPLLTLRHYDYGWTSQHDETPVLSPRDAITVADLGRATIFGAFRGWKAAAAVLEYSGSQEIWPETEADWALDDHPQIDESDWVALASTEAAWKLFSSVSGSTYRGREAAASKILHLKWPKFFPILDGELRRLYHEAALEQEERVPKSRRRTNPSARGYWLAIRCDLLREQNHEAHELLVEQLRMHDGSEHERADLLAGLTRLRLLDCIAWVHQRAAS